MAEGEAPRQAPPGWYDDPQVPGGKRYWDGAQWSEQRQPAPTAPAAPGPPPTSGSPAPGGRRGGFSGWISRRPLLAFWLTLVIALLIGIGIGGASSSTDTQTQDDLDQARQERDAAQQDAEDAKSQASDAEEALAENQAQVQRLQKQIKKAKGAAPEPVAPAEPASTGGEVQEFSGNGSKNLGNLDVPVESLLTWTNDGDLFQIFDDDFAIGVNSQGASGDTVLSSGTYKNVQVNAIGNWTIKIAPR